MTTWWVRYIGGSGLELHYPLSEESGGISDFRAGILYPIRNYDDFRRLGTWRSNPVFELVKTESDDPVEADAPAPAVATAPVEAPTAPTEKIAEKEIK